MKFSILNTKYYVKIEIRGEKVFIAVRKLEDMMMTLVPVLQTNCELLWAQVQISKLLTLQCFYRPPGSKINTTEELVKSSNLISKKLNETIFLGGDFNLPGIDWNNELADPKAANKSP